jgi:hypothetical protein
LTSQRYLAVPLRSSKPGIYHQSAGGRRATRGEGFTSLVGSAARRRAAYNLARPRRHGHDRHQPGFHGNNGTPVLPTRAAGKLSPMLSFTEQLEEDATRVLHRSLAFSSRHLSSTSRTADSAFRTRGGTARGFRPSSWAAMEPRRRSCRPRIPGCSCGHHGDWPGGLPFCSSRFRLFRYWKFRVKLAAVLSRGAG